MPMTKQQALYEICELAGTVIHAAAGPDEMPPELFAWCDTLQDEAIAVGGVSGEPTSDDYKQANKWLMPLVKESRLARSLYATVK